MPRRRFHLTESAIRDYRKAAYESARDFGKAQSDKYRRQLREGFQRIADEHPKLRTQHREDLAAGTPFKIHLVRRHYIVYQVHDRANIILVAVLPESMDLPTRLKELERLTRDERAALRRDISSPRRTRH